MNATLKRLGLMNRSPLDVTFAIQLPIYHMHSLETIYSADDLRISHRSSIDNIIDNGLVVENFSTGIDKEEESSEINEYTVRLMEADLECQQLIAKLGDDGSIIHPPTVTALLPPMYRANAVITFQADNIQNFLSSGHLVLEEMFFRINQMITSINTSIQDAM
jgi:hypothetical protein